jgi:thioredoxin-related protein
MFSVSWCGFCTRFHNEVGDTYKDSEYAKDIPLIIINGDDYTEHIPKWFEDAYREGIIKPIRGTPTFIIWDEKKKVEIDRLVGYNGKKWFYIRLAYQTFDLLDTNNTEK